MRTIEEIDQHITDCQMALDDNSGYIPCEDDAYHGGMIAGFKEAKRLIERGWDAKLILHHARVQNGAYVSRGYELRDAHQSGYTAAMCWAGEEFDWDADGNVIMREDEVN